MESSAGSVPLPPLFPNNFNFPPNDQCRGTGQLSWLSPKAGLITCASCSNRSTPITVSFQLKDFCDVGVSDLTSVLRVGFRLAFSAMSAADSNDYIANYVAPISDSDLNNGVFNDTKELDLEAIEQSLGAGVRQAHKDPYSLEMELQSLYFLLSIFHKSSVHFIPLSNLHSRISNSGKEELYRYIGSSSLKRRQFIERRSYIFHIAENDVVFLQPPEIYTTVCLLTGFLLSHGGVTSSDALFAFFTNNSLVPPALKDTIKTSRVNFMSFLSRHLFAFAPFPSQFYVSVRRNLPYFDYNSFIKKNFPACVFSRTPHVPNFPPNRSIVSSFNNFEHLNDNVSNFQTPATPITPIFQEDPIITAQKMNRVGSGNGTSVWQNEIGYFEHQPTINNVISLSGAPPGKVPIVGSTAIVGRSANSAFSLDSGKNDFSKIDLSRRPAELNLRNSNSPVLTMRKVMIDGSTQTDGDYMNGRPVGFNSRCRCKCTCGESIIKQSSENLLNLSNGHNFLFGTDFSMPSILQRPVSVQDQLVQRPLFSTGNNGTSEKTSAKSTTVTNKPLESLTDLDALNDSFFNHTLQSFASAFMPNTTSSSAMVNENCFAPTSDIGVFDVAPTSITDSAISLTSSPATNSSLASAVGQQGLPMPIGGGTNGTSAKNNLHKSGNEASTNGSNSNASNTKSNSVDLSDSATQDRSYDPFGKSMPFELKFSSLKL